jgi:hypothetical protein
MTTATAMLRHGSTSSAVPSRLSRRPPPPPPPFSLPLPCSTWPCLSRNRGRSGGQTHRCRRNCARGWDPGSSSSRRICQGQKNIQAGLTEAGGKSFVIWAVLFVVFGKEIVESLRWELTFEYGTPAVRASVEKVALLSVRDHLKVSSVSLLVWIRSLRQPTNAHP